MDSRTALKANTVLSFKNKENSIVLYTIEKEIGRGGSCIVYDAFYYTNAGDKKLVRIKECYPFRFDIKRCETGELTASHEYISDFIASQKKMWADFKVNNVLFYNDKLNDTIINTIDIYEYNNTVYIVSAYLIENTLAEFKPDSLKSCISIIKNVAEAVKCIHDEGYLYLDLKPDNILIIDGISKRIQLFDFDSLILLSALKDKSKQNINDLRLSYTKGFAALELQMGSFNKLSFYTDVYGIGALLFYVLFGFTPSAFDCEINADYDFSSIEYFNVTYHDRLYFLLTDFFHNTLASFYFDRYQDMTHVINQLDEIEKYADTALPFIMSTRINKQSFFIGREDELNKIDLWFNQNQNNCLFIIGMGGIGKSSLLHEYITVNRDKFSSVINLYYKGSFQEMICDDMNFHINTIEKNEKESISEYYIRKLKKLREIMADENSILIIDNFDGEIDEDFSFILNIGFRIIVLTRKNIKSQSFDTINLNALQKQDDLYLLFEYYSNRSIDACDFVFLDNIINKTSGHTLLIELIAKQVSNSYLSISEASALVDMNGLSNIAAEKVDYVKDQIILHETIVNIISDIFNTDAMESFKKAILITLSFFDMPGIDINILNDILEYTSKDDINELIRDGWINIDGKILFLHPIIRENILTWEWTDDTRAYIYHVMKYIYKQIKIEEVKIEYPKKMLTDIQFLKNLTENNDEFNTWAEQHFSQYGMFGELVKEQIRQSDSQTQADYKKLSLYIKLSESVLNGCEKDNQLKNSSLYIELLYLTLITIPRDRESYILEKSSEIFDNPACTNKLSMLMLIDKLVFILCEKNDFDDAYSMIMKAKRIIKHSRDNHLLGIFHDILAQYYDELLGGNYTVANKDNKKLQSLLLNSINKSISYMKKSKEPDSKSLLAKYILSKITVLLRSDSCNIKTIDKLLATAKKLALENTQQNSETRCIYNLVSAWYFTIFFGNYDAVMEFIQYAYEIAEEIYTSDLDIIDFIIVPCSNMLYQIDQLEKAEEWLKNGIDICERYNEMIPYIRKKIDLYSYLLDVYYVDDNIDKCKEIIAYIDYQNEINIDIGVHKIISHEVRDEIQML